MVAIGQVAEEGTFLWLNKVRFTKEGNFLG